MPSHRYVYIHTCAVISSFSAEFRARPSFLKVDVSILNVPVKDKTNNTHTPSQKIHKGPTMCHHLRAPVTKKAVVCLYLPPQIFFYYYLFIPNQNCFCRAKEEKTCSPYNFCKLFILGMLSGFSL